MKNFKQMLSNFQALIESTQTDEHLKHTKKLLKNLYIFELRKVFQFFRFSHLTTNFATHKTAT